MSAEDSLAKSTAEEAQSDAAPLDEPETSVEEDDESSTVLYDTVYQCSICLESLDLCEGDDAHKCAVCIEIICGSNTCLFRCMACRAKLCRECVIAAEEHPCVGGQLATVAFTFAHRKLPPRVTIAEFAAQRANASARKRERPAMSREGGKEEATSTTIAAEQPTKPKRTLYSKLFWSEWADLCNGVYVKEIYDTFGVEKIADMSCYGMYPGYAIQPCIMPKGGDTFKYAYIHIDRYAKVLKCTCTNEENIEQIARGLVEGDPAHTFTFPIADIFSPDAVNQ